MSAFRLASEGLSEQEGDVLARFLHSAAPHLTAAWCGSAPEDCDVLVIDSQASLHSTVVDAARRSGVPVLVGYHRRVRTLDGNALQLEAPLQLQALCEVLNAAAARLMARRRPAAAPYDSLPEAVLPAAKWRALLGGWRDRLRYRLRWMR